MGVGASAPIRDGIRTPCKKAFVWQRRMIPKVINNKAREFPRIPRQPFRLSRIESRRRLKVHRINAPTAEASRTQNSATIGSRVRSPKYRLVSHPPIASERKRKHWLECRFGLAWKTINPKPT